MKAALLLKRERGFSLAQFAATFDPNHPKQPTSPDESLDSKKLHKATDDALDHYLCPTGSTPPPRKTRRMYAVTADFKNEELLTDASETLTPARTIANDFVHLIPASQRRTLLGIVQLIMLGELAVNRVLVIWRCRTDARVVNTR